jgi:hypothetical protein
MSKAYDSVNIALLEKALHRIKLPPSIVLTIINLLSLHTNQVITNFGLTPTYPVEDGIDQGETITPLLWRIYYDPLIHYIHTKFKGYTIATTKITSLFPLKHKKIQANTSILAYMDDTLWIADSQQQLQNILNTASTFYQMANIKVNPNKSTLISNTKLTPTFNFMDTTIQTQTPDTPLKFLGCWYTATNKQSIISKIIIQETTGLTNIIQTKQITDKQTSYVINNVIIPIFEYRIHNIVLSHNTCNKILSRYLTVAKHKSKLPVTTPNSTMLNHNIYRIKNI